MSYGKSALQTKKAKRTLVCLLAASMCQSALLAENLVDKIGVSGFLTAKYQQLDDDNFFNGDQKTGVGKDGSWQDTKIGINLTAPVNDKISVATQFFATKDDNFNLTLDWGFVSYAVSDEITIRAGKIKFPVGLVNEYVDVGNTYPWITAPELFYTENLQGPNITRESYTGTSVLWRTSTEDTDVGINIFGGEINLESMDLRKLVGISVRMAWNDTINFQTSYYQGTMHNTLMSVMEEKTHSNFAVGINFDWNDIIGYAEWATTDMEVETMNGTSWYTTLGYQMDEWLPYLTHQHLDKGKESTNPQKQQITTAGLRYDLSDTMDLKVEYSLIKTQSGQGLFESIPADERANRFGIAVDVVF